MAEIAKSNKYELNADSKKVENAENLTKKEVDELATHIVNTPENQNQVKAFPDLWESLNDQQKSDFVSKLEWEIRDTIDELKSLWVEKEYSPEITQEDADKVADLEFIRDNKDKIPQSWSKLEMKANEVAKEMMDDIKKEWLDRSLKN